MGDSVLRRPSPRGLRALWSDVDLARGTITVERSLEAKEGFVAPKSRAGNRVVPIVGVLRDYLLDMRSGRAKNDGFVFARPDGEPFAPATVLDRAQRAWRAAGLKPIDLHEARHTCARVLIAAGVNAKAITTYMGHSSVQVTFDLYGHLMPGAADEARALVDAYLERANTQARLAQLD